MKSLWASSVSGWLQSRVKFSANLLSPNSLPRCAYSKVMKRSIPLMRSMTECAKYKKQTYFVVTLDVATHLPSYQWYKMLWSFYKLLYYILSGVRKCLQHQVHVLWPWNSCGICSLHAHVHIWCVYCIFSYVNMFLLHVFFHIYIYIYLIIWKMLTLLVHTHCLWCNIFAHGLSGKTSP